MTGRTHWDNVYRTRAPAAVSWYRPRLDISLAFIDTCGLAADAHIVDIGGGASTLVDDLLARGYMRVSVADLSAEALAHAKARLGEAADAVRWIVGDATGPLVEDASVSLWHDRAVFHFLTQPSQRDAYLSALRRAVGPGGFVILATFGPDGPERCSGLPVVRYSAHELAGLLGDDFARIGQAEEEHITPAGGTQAFAYVLCQRRTPAS